MKRILVIDDEQWLREMVRMALSEKGYEVVEAENGTAGIETARRALPDLILCDVNMEKCDGYSTLSSLRNEPSTASIPFILMTGLADHAGMRHGMELGADDYLPKPFSLDALYGAVEARLKKLQTVREQAEKKLSDLRDNLSMMLPHELRTPLNGILAYGDILRSDAPNLEPAEIVEMGQVIYESGRRLERVVENFLIYAQMELLAADPQKAAALARKTTPHPVKLIEEHARAQAEQAHRPNDLELDLLDLAIPMSEDYLGKVINELVQNAFKFSPTGTRVSLTLFEAPNHVTLSITDRGRGFSTEHITRVGAYMQFDRKLQEQQGLGLGLIIARRLAELHGGTLVIESKLDCGTTVSLKLPKARAH